MSLLNGVVDVVKNLIGDWPQPSRVNGEICARHRRIKEVSYFCKFCWRPIARNSFRNSVLCLEHLSSTALCKQARRLHDRFELVLDSIQDELRRDFSYESQFTTEQLTALAGKVSCEGTQLNSNIRYIAYKIAENLPVNVRATNELG